MIRQVVALITLIITSCHAFRTAVTLTSSRPHWRQLAALKVASDNNIHDDDVGVISSYFDSDVETQPCQECNNNNSGRRAFLTAAATTTSVAMSFLSSVLLIPPSPALADEDVMVVEEKATAAVESI